MGDQVGVAVSGTHYYVPFREFQRVRNLTVSAVERAQLFAALCRINTLYMIARAGSGHIGSSFSSMDIICWMQLYELRSEAEVSPPRGSDVFFSSKGHDAPGLYSAWIGMGKLSFDLIHQLRRLNGLPGHPDVSTPNVVTNTGSLGMGVSKAKGMIIANRLREQPANVYVLTGDGELQEGQFWESLISAANHKLHELTVIIDHNKLQSDTLVSKVSDLGDIEAKLAAFGWHVSRCAGNDVAAFSQTLAATKSVGDKPKAIIADTTKGKGVSFMEHTSIDSDVEFYRFHSGAPTEDAYVRAAQELIDNANALLVLAAADRLQLESVTLPATIVPEAPQRLIAAYSHALIKQARQNSKIVALDADLILDSGLIPFQKEFPDRLIECGIAEQDMVSQAGGMALRGLLPVVHSFACFLAARPNEQIYNNATERSKVVYVASLAGVVPGGPGHSHQGVRDISSLAAIPGLTMMEPSCELEVAMLLDWALNSNALSSYLRLVSLPFVPPYKLPDDYVPEYGRGVALTEGTDAMLFSYGPVMLSLAVEAATVLKAEHGYGLKVVNLPWLNYIDSSWLASEVIHYKTAFAVDNHYRQGGQGDRIGDALHAIGLDRKLSLPALHRIALDEIPECGTNPEILRHHRLDRDSVVATILASQK